MSRADGLGILMLGKKGLRRGAVGVFASALLAPVRGGSVSVPGACRVLSSVPGFCPLAPAAPLRRDNQNYLPSLTRVPEASAGETAALCGPAFPDEAVEPLVTRPVARAPVGLACPGPGPCGLPFGKRWKYSHRALRPNGNSPLRISVLGFSSGGTSKCPRFP